MWNSTKMLQAPTRRPFLLPHSSQITPHSKEALGGAGARALQGAAWASSAAWPSVNLVFLFPFTLWTPTRFLSLFATNGATATGNRDVGVYDDGGGTTTINRLVSTGPQALSGTSVPDPDAIDIILGEGDYFAALLADSTSATFAAKTAGDADIAAMLGCKQVTDNGSNTLGATLTYIDCAQTMIPHFGLSQVSTY